MKSHETKAELTITEILLPENMILSDNGDTGETAIIKSDISIGP